VTAEEPFFFDVMDIWPRVERNLAIDDIHIPRHFLRLQPEGEFHT